MGFIKNAVIKTVRKKVQDSVTNAAINAADDYLTETRSEKVLIQNSIAQSRYFIKLTSSWAGEEFDVQDSDKHTILQIHSNGKSGKCSSISLCDLSNKEIVHVYRTTVPREVAIKKPPIAYRYNLFSRSKSRGYADEELGLSTSIYLHIDQPNMRNWKIDGNFITGNYYLADATGFKVLEIKKAYTGFQKDEYLVDILDSEAVDIEMACIAFLMIRFSSTKKTD